MYSVSADRPACLNGRTTPFISIYERHDDLDAHPREAAQFGASVPLRGTHRKVPQRKVQKRPS